MTDLLIPIVLVFFINFCVAFTCRTTTLCRAEQLANGDFTSGKCQQSIRMNVTMVPIPDGGSRLVITLDYCLNVTFACENRTKGIYCFYAVFGAVRSSMRSDRCEVDCRFSPPLIASQNLTTIAVSTTTISTMPATDTTRTPFAPVATPKASIVVTSVPPPHTVNATTAATTSTSAATIGVSTGSKQNTSSTVAAVTLGMFVVDSDNDNTAIIGGVIGAVAMAVSIVVLAWFVMRARAHRRSRNDNEEPVPSSAGDSDREQRATSAPQPVKKPTVSHYSSRQSVIASHASQYDALSREEVGVAK
jgi:hypothetical protein